MSQHTWDMQVKKRGRGLNKRRKDAGWIKVWGKQNKTFEGVNSTDLYVERNEVGGRSRDKQILKAVQGQYEGSMQMEMGKEGWRERLTGWAKQQWREFESVSIINKGI